MSVFDVTIAVRVPWRAKAWLRLMRIARPVIGERRATEWGLRGMWRLMRMRIGNGKWKRLEGTLRVELP